MTAKTAAHKVVAMSNSDGDRWCKVCGEAVADKYSRNGRHVAVHAASISARNAS